MPVTIAREDLIGRLSEASNFPIVLVRGSAGCGKSVALRDFLIRYQRPFAYYDVGREHRTFARFVRGFADAIGDFAPGARVAFGSAYELAMQSKQPEAVLAKWLAQHLKPLDLTLVLDNVHNAAADPLSEALLGRLIDESGDNVRWIVSCRNADAFSVPVWMAFRRMDVPIEDRDLAFTAESVAQLALAMGLALDYRECADIAIASDGWATGVAALLQARRTGSPAPSEVRSFAPLIERSLSECDSWELRALLGTSFLPELSGELLPDGAVRATVKRLYERAPYVFSSSGDTMRYHDLFADALQERLRGSDPRETHAAIASAGLVLRRQSRFVEALELYSAAGASEAIVALLELHGVQLVERGDADVVATALERLDRSGRVLSPIVLALHALVESRLGRFDTSESWFNQALQRAGGDDARMIEIKYLYACDLMRRYRPDALDLLGEHARDPELPRELRAAVLSAWAQALVLDGQTSPARAAIGEALDLVRDLHGDDALVARVLTRASYVYLYGGLKAEAKRYATAAAALATRSSLFAVATGAYSVLYAVACDEEDPGAARGSLGLLLENGLKAGNLAFQFYYLANTFEIDAERYDLDGLARTDRALKSFDLHYDDADSREALLPGQALRASWSGEFDYAFRLLQPTASQQAGDDRTALRWAEVSVYAAAAGRNGDAREAVERSKAALATADEESNRTARARLLLALTVALLGSVEEGVAMLDALGRNALPGRLHALGRAIAVLHDRMRGANNHDALDAALRALDAASFGGFARLIEALPLRALEPIP